MAGWSEFHGPGMSSLLRANFNVGTYVSSTSNGTVIIIRTNSYLDFVLVSFGTGAWGLGSWHLWIREWNWDGLGPSLDPAGLDWTPGRMELNLLCHYSLSQSLAKHGRTRCYHGVISIFLTRSFVCETNQFPSRAPVAVVSSLRKFSFFKQ